MKIACWLSGRLREFYNPLLLQGVICILKGVNIYVRLIKGYTIPVQSNYFGLIDDNT
jgi:hypothetical protein